MPQTDSCPDLIEDEARRGEALSLIRALYPNCGIIVLIAQDDGENLSIGTASNMAEVTQIPVIMEFTTSLIRRIFCSPPTNQQH